MNVFKKWRYFRVIMTELPGVLNNSIDIIRL